MQPSPAPPPRTEQKGPRRGAPLPWRLGIRPLDALPRARHHRRVVGLCPADEARAGSGGTPQRSGGAAMSPGQFGPTMGERILESARMERLGAGIGSAIVALMKLSMFIAFWHFAWRFW